MHKLSWLTSSGEHGCELSHFEPLIGQFAPHLDFSEGYSAYTPAA